jgi:SpoVK/Ycf46/Vps4 family AAA+-type ATPase
MEYVELAHVCKEICSALEVKAFDLLEILIGSSGSHQQRCVVQVLPTTTGSTNQVLIHPILFDALSVIDQQDYENETQDDCKRLTAAVDVGPLMLPSMCQEYGNDDDPDTIQCSVRKPIRSLTNINTIQLSCVYVDIGVDSSNLQQLVHVALSNRWVMNGALVLLSLAAAASVADDDDCYMLALVSSIQAEEGAACRLGSVDTFQVHLQPPMDNSLFERATVSFNNDWAAETTCPGYQSLLQELKNLLCSVASPSGVLLTGCSGAGKSRVASALAYDLARDYSWNIHWTSLQEVLLRASWASEEVLLDLLGPKQNGPDSLLIVDDLDVLAMETADDLLMLDNERRLVLNVLIQVLDKAVASGVRIVGISQDESMLPLAIVKIGRLEKIVSVHTPSQLQRELILVDILQQSSALVHVTVLQWAQLLASATAGFVAADLRRLAADAWTRAISKSGETNAVPTWDDWREAVMSCTPSQLAALDVIKPTLFLNNTTRANWLDIHESSWKQFAGYDSIKKRLFRTVVAPWRRLLSSELGQTSPVAPPSGLLFHGESGCGKSLAASCIQSSIGLPMIKVRASDVLDKWLGGSEAAVRSLFARARSAAPCIIFFDEIDAIASNRSMDEETNDVMSRLLSTLLNEMDGISGGQGGRVLVVACTNRLLSLDAALLRPGRLEEHIELSLPDYADARSVLYHYLANVPLEATVDLDSIAKELVDKKASAAELEGLAREAVIRALRRCDQGSISVSKNDFDHAITALKL